jgi:hypothetical protein
MNDLVWSRSFRDKLSRVELWCAALAREVHRGFRRKLSESPHRCNSSGVDPMPPFVNDRFARIRTGAVAKLFDVGTWNLHLVRHDGPESL